jgi:natural product biosynthesis luciferase-like monooxygenase protein/amino acid adenylation domain-containing protein
MILDTHEVSPLQAGMLFHAAAATHIGVDIEQIIATLHERLDEGAFLRAWERLLERHAILRTRFRWQGLAQPVQEVVDRVRVPVQWFDWRALAEPERRARLETLIEEQRARGFDTAQAPLMRLALVRMGEAEHAMVWTIHHLLSDARSRLLLLQELFACYEGKALAPPTPYRAYIGWLRAVDHERSRPYWRELLAGFRAPTPLVVGHNRDDRSYGVHECRLPSALTGALRRRAREARITLNVLLQGAWALLLHRYSGESDIVFGVTRDVRPPALAGAREIVGLLINTLPVRIRVDPEAQLVPWLAGLRATQLGGREFGHTPLVQVHGWSDVPREAPLFETLFVFDRHTFDAQLRAQGGPWSRRAFVGRNQTNYPLTLAAYGEEELLLQLQYARRRLDDDAVARMGGHLRTLLEGMAAAPLARLRDLPLLTPAEEHRLVHEWNATSAPYRPARCVHELVEAQARLRPGALAAQDGACRLTYRELDERAERLAGRLRRHGVQPDSLVAVDLERSADLLVALLAVWKAGAAYVPIDRAYPAERVRFMLEDTRAPMVLTQRSLAALFEEPEPKPEKENPRICASPDRLAYVIYTSGSTGVPKGVPITHRALYNLICWHRQAYAVTAADRATQIGAPAFDAAVWEIWPYLCAGASVHIAEEATRLDARLLVRWLTERRITLAFLPTPLAEAALREPWPERCALRALLTGGDKLNPPPTQKLPFRVVNHYGPTENTVVSTCAEVPSKGTPPIGRPLPNTAAYVVDRYLQPVPVGVPGELLVGGVQLSPGYWNRPQLTAAAFIQHLGRRLYRTGDLVRWRADGNLEFLGRVDDQVKIRGFRIEPGEIEALIARHPAVREVVVTARDQQLVAYVAAEKDVVGELRAQLGAHLPRYMIPAHFVRLARLPLSEHGKVDRKALPAPRWEPRAQGTAPRTPLERSLEKIWAEVLGVERVGIEEDFFALGGHSLAAMQVVSRVREALGTELAVRELFAAPTIERVAERIEALPEAAAAPPLVPGVPGAGELSFSQQRLWFLDQLQPQSPAYVIALALELRGRLDVAALERAAAGLVRRHEALRTVFLNVGGRPTQVVRQAPGQALLLVELSAEREPDTCLAGALHEEARRPFDLARGPLFRARLYRLGPQRHVLSLVMHHIIADGWSIGILARELAELYSGYARGDAPALPVLPVQYRDYARWQRQWLQGERLEQLLAHWRERLAGAPQVLALPADRPRPAVESNRGARYRFALPLELTDALRALARREGATLFMTLLAGFSVLLARYSGQRDLLIGTPVANRSRAQLEAVVGCFVNIVVLRAELSGEPCARDLIGRLRERCLDAFAHQELPFDRLVEELQPARDLSRNPLFQVMFALHNATERLELPGLAARSLELDPGAAKVDLALELEETPQGLAAWFEYATDLFDEATIARMAAHWRVLLESMAAAPERSVWQLELLSQAERAALEQWNRTEAPAPALGCVHWQIEAQVRRTPDKVGLIFEDKEITYAQLDEKADRLAARLIELGVGPDRLVGVHLTRSIAMVVAVLAVLKAGGAYVPLDPGFPAERLRYMAADAGLAVVLSQRGLPRLFDQVILVDDEVPPAARSPVTPVTPANLAYVLYTSGSSGRPKGVMVEHRNVTSFFAAMDACIAHDAPGTWLALTSLSFDISVLELLWPLARGFKVVIQGELEDYFVADTKAPSFSLFMWGNDDAPGRDKYRLMLEGAKYFDRNGFEAVWTPERHFHAFGGPYPNPSVTAAALAAVTERIGIRAGSCVSPLHHPIRIAEEWAVVDNLSNGRVAIAFASGWQPDDFILRPENYGRRQAVMLEQIDQVRRLWRGEKLPVETLPRPVQRELPFWVTTAGNPQSYRQAGELGANVLTHLLGQTLEEVAEKIALYRQARAAAGHDPAAGRVTLMLHTFVGADDAEVRELVRRPMKDYLRSSLRLAAGSAGGEGRLDPAFERYFETSGLFGTPATCARMVERCKQAGVDEIACLLDFGVASERVLASLPFLNEVRKAAARQRFPLAAQIERHAVTHLQCTPSTARLLLADARTRAALGGLRQMLVGGEALPPALARELKAALGGEVRNMYGPTETTVWSASQPLFDTDSVSIGRPIANTQIHIVDHAGEPLPVGVPGEIVIGGAGVARGYWKRPELTKQRFFSRNDTRLYRTGDLGRFLPDGRIEFLGRADGQVKIRGYRVELGEIEGVLAEHAGVGVAAVAVHDSNLVAYVVGDAESAALRAYLREKLPHYMLPADFVRLERLPLTPNGKLDRRALPAPSRAAAAEFVAPATPTEQALAQLWQRMLGVERIGTRDNFFDSGGHSLLAVQLLGRVHERFGIELPLKHVFERPTLAELAQAIDALAWMETASAPAPGAAEREEALL